MAGPSHTFPQPCMEWPFRSEHDKAARGMRDLAQLFTMTPGLPHLGLDGTKWTKVRAAYLGLP